MAEGATAAHGWSLAHSKGLASKDWLIPTTYRTHRRARRDGVKKKCQMCNQDKPLTEFFCADFDGRAGDVRTGKFCKQCHSEGRIEHGYGWIGFGGMFSTPMEAVA